ncbi:MAG: 50S ribosomal protein L11 methyltransferase [Kofleriaceae bacterium]|nr:50S ribosomal protein L11 methyltransferase [Kofleriaceae bacterium]MCB9574989.1 50S ribosomal protein L11 methyltransferase [Kofleriaceae bacterium]
MPTLWGYLDAAQHAVMLLDTVRVDAYAAAIAKVVRPGDVVLDAGTGSGILAMLAARAGARKVYAVDGTGAVELARRHVADNGLADVVEVLRVDLAALEALPEPPRVIVGELLGSFAPDEHQHRLYASLRRLARPDAELIPRRYRLVYGIARASGLRADLARLGDVHGLDLTVLRQRLRNRAAFVHVDPAELLGPEVDGPWIATDAPPPRELTATVIADRDGEVGAVTCGFTAELADGVALRTAVTAERTHWQQTLFPVDPPLPVRAGDALAVQIVPRMITQHWTWAWSVRRGDEVRHGDGFDALSGDKADLLTQIRGRPRLDGAIHPGPLLRAWAAGLGGAAPDPLDLDAVAARMQAADPARYPNLDEARQDLLLLLAAADRAR